MADSNQVPSTGAASFPPDSDWFLNVKALTVPKELGSLQQLWQDMLPTQMDIKFTSGNSKVKLIKITKHQLNALLELCEKSLNDEETSKKLDEVISKMDDGILYSVIRVLHVKNHLREIDEEISEVTKPEKMFAKSSEDEILHSKLILQSFLDYLKQNGMDSFQDFINETTLRLISTVHPNETERNTNLRHYNTIHEKFIEWKRNHESLRAVPTNAPEYRIRRESLNQIRRAIKAEIEGVWQTDQMRRDPIPVQSEARRILERYKVIFNAVPMFVKFVKHLAQEAFWLYQASIRYSQDKQWRETYLKIQASLDKKQFTREDVLVLIKRTFKKLGIELKPPRIVRPIVTFGTWKGGDRDGNPFVVASFTNQAFIDQKQFVLEHYIDYAKELLEALTPSTSNVVASPALEESLKTDWKKFPYLNNVKPHEPYRAKMRFILEKLEVSLTRVKEVKKQAGETTKPLLGQTIPGPIGYCAWTELQQDINVLYQSLIENGGKNQARSMLQDFQILVDTFGMHLTSIDFRQTSEKNLAALKEYLTIVEYPDAANLAKKTEKQKQAILMELLQSDQYEFNPWVLTHLSSISKDSFETLLIFSDVARADLRAVGKFIISMCGQTSDILILLFLLKLVGMLEVIGNRITWCPFDVAGLFETIADLKEAPRIVRELLNIPLIRDYIMQHRQGKLTIMMGYSDSVRDGSSLASDAQIPRTSLALRNLEEELNQALEGTQKIRLILYRGRGDTIPRGYGGSIAKALASQLFTGPEEDHTEQNRYLRCYSSLSSAVDHLHRVYSSHVSCQLSVPPSKTLSYQRYFDFFGKISNIKWLELVAPKTGLGDQYFTIFSKYSILPHLPKSYFASRPVARDGVTYNIDSIRAIPFTMFLAQMREFTNAYYGTGTAFEMGSAFLLDPKAPLYLLKYFMDTHLQSDQDRRAFKRKFMGHLEQPTAANVLEDLIKLSSQEYHDENTEKDSPLITLLRIHHEKDIDQLFALADGITLDPLVRKVLALYPSSWEAVECVAHLLLDLLEHKYTPLDVLQEMHHKYPPFRYSLENKETSLLIRNKKIVDEYTKDATREERAILDATESEAQLAKHWLLKIMQQDTLRSKTISRDFQSPELYLLHKIQTKYLSKYKEMVAKKAPRPEMSKMEMFIQMSILALSEALGFAG